MSIRDGPACFGYERSPGTFSIESFRHLDQCFRWIERIKSIGSMTCRRVISLAHLRRMVLEKIFQLRDVDIAVNALSWIVICQRVSMIVSDDPVQLEWELSVPAFVLPFAWDFDVLCVWMEICQRIFYDNQWWGTSWNRQLKDCSAPWMRIVNCQGFHFRKAGWAWSLWCFSCKYQSLFSGIRRQWFQIANSVRFLSVLPVFRAVFELFQYSRFSNTDSSVPFCSVRIIDSSLFQLVDISVNRRRFLKN
jgi:hypothetical protein